MIRTHQEALRGRTPEDVLDFVKRAMALSRVQEISIRPDSIVVRREMDSEDQPVVPSIEPAQEKIDIEFLLERLDLRPWPLEPEGHPYSILATISQQLSRKSLHPSIIIVSAQDRELFSAWLGYEDYPEAHFMGFRIVYWDSDQYPEKIVVVGTHSSSGYLTDAIEGVVVDLV